MLYLIMRAARLSNHWLTLYIKGIVITLYITFSSIIHFQYILLIFAFNVVYSLSC